MFTPGLDGHQIGFAMGEAIAHLNHLVTLGHMKLIETPDAGPLPPHQRERRPRRAGVRVMPGPFGDHQLKIPYEPVADLLAKYARRDPGKTAIVDLESGTAIDFGQLDRVAIDIAAYLKSKGIRKGSRVLVLSDECLEKLLIWFGVWRIGAVICPFNLEINEKQMVSLTAALKPALILYHKDIDVAAMVGDAPAERVRFGAWSADGAKDPQDELFVGAAARRRGAACPSATTPTTPPASSAPRAPRRGRRSSSTTTPPTG